MHTLWSEVWLMYIVIILRQRTLNQLNIKRVVHRTGGESCGPLLRAPPAPGCGPRSNGTMSALPDGSAA